MADAEKSPQKTESMCALLDVTARTRHRNGKIRRDFVLIVVFCFNRAHRPEIATCKCDPNKKNGKFGGARESLIFAFEIPTEIMEQTNLCSDPPKNTPAQQTTNPATDGSSKHRPNRHSGVAQSSTPQPRSEPDQRQETRHPLPGI